MRSWLLPHGLQITTLRPSPAPPPCTPETSGRARGRKAAGRSVRPPTAAARSWCRGVPRRLPTGSPAAGPLPRPRNSTRPACLPAYRPNECAAPPAALAPSDGRARTAGPCGVEKHQAISTPSRTWPACKPPAEAPRHPGAEFPRLNDRVRPMFDGHFADRLRRARRRGGIERLRQQPPPVFQPPPVQVGRHAPTTGRPAALDPLQPRRGRRHAAHRMSPSRCCRT